MRLRKLIAAFVAFGLLSGGIASAQKSAVKAKTAKSAKASAVTKKVASRVRDYNVGDIGPGGGFIFLENKNYKSDGWRYLEAYWSDELFNVKYEDGAKLVSKLRAGNKSDWFVPGESDLNELISALGYPKGMLPPGRYYVSGGKKTVGMSFDVKTKKRTLGKLPARFDASNAKLSKNSKLAALEGKRSASLLGNVVAVRKVTVSEITSSRSVADLVRIRGISRSSSAGRTQQDQEIEQEAQQAQVPQSQSVSSATAFTVSSQAPSRTDYSALDEYVRTLPISASDSIETVARKVCQTAKNDKEKARAIFAWIGYNIAYDNDTYYSTTLSSSEKREIGIYDPDKTFQRRMGVCEGYSKLFIKMGEAVGLHSEYCSGYGKVGGHTVADPKLGSHGWNEVTVGNSKMLIDVTWGAAESQDGTGVPELQDCWFDCDPGTFVFTHFPAPSVNQTRTPQPEKQHLSKPISEAMFRALPGMKMNYILAGFVGQDIINFTKSHPQAWRVKSYDNVITMAGKAGVRVNKIELSDQIVVGDTCRFNFKIPSGKSVMAYLNGSPLGELKNNTDFDISCTEAGSLVFYFNQGDGRLWALFVYDVVNSRSAPQASAVSSAFASY